MQQDFNFDKIGKKMPYKVPEGFFSDLESSLNGLAAVSTAHVNKPAAWLWAVRTALTAAAVVAIIFSLTIMFPKNRNISSNESISVEQAFSNLSTSDQDYIIDTFRNDMIIDY